MSKKDIPLVEAILEVRWNFESKPTQPIGMPMQDPDFTFFSGDFYNLLKTEFPVRNLIQNAPIELQLPHIVQHRFQKEKGTWPIVQLGPGIFTVNETTEYNWPSFLSLSKKIYSNFIQSKVSNYNLMQLNLKYINSFPIIESLDLFDHLQKSMNIKFELPSFNDENILDSPSSYNSNFTFILKEPVGTINISINKGQVNNEDAIILQLDVRSNGTYINRYKEDINEWLEKAHIVAENVFFSFYKDKK